MLFFSDGGVYRNAEIEQQLEHGQVHAVAGRAVDDPLIRLHFQEPQRAIERQRLRRVEMMEKSIQLQRGLLSLEPATEPSAFETEDRGGDLIAHKKTRRWAANPRPGFSLSIW